MYEIFKKTIQYTKFHFSCEEKMMVKSKYRLHKEHRCQHYALIEALNNFYAKYMEGAIPTIELMEFLRDWIGTHILKEDIVLSKDIQDIRDLNFKLEGQGIIEDLYKQQTERIGRK